jgi:hypothetical protein
MATIAAISSKLTLNTATYVAALARARKATGEFVSSAQSKVVGLSAAIAAAATGGGMALLVQSSYSTIDALAKTADKLGLTTDNLARLRYAADLAGVGNEQFDKSLQKMVLNLADAAQGTGSARGAIAELGLDAAALASSTPDAAFRDIADAITKVPSATDRARLAYQLFGKEGVAMVNVLSQGKVGLIAAGEEADKLGLSISRVDAAKIEAANDAMSRAKAVFQGAANTIAVQLAPWITTASTRFMELATSGEGVGTRIIGAFEWVLRAIGSAADWLELLRAGFYMLQSGATAAVWGVVKSIDMAGTGLVKLLNLLPGVHVEWTDTFSMMSDELLRSIDESAGKAQASWDRFNSGANSAAIAKTFADIRAGAHDAAQAVADSVSKTQGVAAATEDWEQKLKAAEEAHKKIGDILTDLRRQVDTFGMGEGQKMLIDLRALGASPEQLADAHAMLDQLEQLQQRQEALKAMQSEAKSIFDSTRTPLEKYNTTIERLGEMLNEGVLDWDTYGRAVRQAREELEKSGKADAPSLITAGSAEAQRIAFASTRGIQPRKDDTPRKQLQTQERMAKSLEVIERKIQAPASSAAEEVDI